MVFIIIGAVLAINVGVLMVLMKSSSRRESYAEELMLRREEHTLGNPSTHHAS